MVHLLHRLYGVDAPGRRCLGEGKCSDTSYSSALFTLHRPNYRLLDTRTPYLHDPGPQRRPCCCCIAGQCVISVAVNHCVLSILDLTYSAVSQSAVKLGVGIPPDLRSGTSCLRSTTSNNRSCTSQLRSSQLRSGTFLLGFTNLHSLYLSIFFL